MTGSLHDILVAWQNDEIGYRRALDLAQIDTLDELYDAAALSGVALRVRLTDAEDASATLLAQLLRDRPGRPAA